MECAHIGIEFGEGAVRGGDAHPAVVGGDLHGVPVAQGGLDGLKKDVEAEKARNKALLGR